MSSEIYAQGYQDSLLGVEPASTSSEYMAGYNAAIADGNTGFGGIDTPSFMETTSWLAPLS